MYAYVSRCCHFAEYLVHLPRERGERVWRASSRCPRDVMHSLERVAPCKRCSSATLPLSFSLLRSPALFLSHLILFVAARAHSGHCARETNQDGRSERDRLRVVCNTCYRFPAECTAFCGRQFFSLLPFSLRKVSLANTHLLALSITPMVPRDPLSRS